MTRLTESKDQGEGTIAFGIDAEKPFRLCLFMNDAPETNCSRENSLLSKVLQVCVHLRTCASGPWKFWYAGKYFSGKNLAHPRIDVWHKAQFSAEIIQNKFCLGVEVLRHKIKGTRTCARAKLAYLCTQNKLTILSLFHFVYKSPGRKQYAQLRFSTGKLICHVNSPKA